MVGKKGKTQRVFHFCQFFIQVAATHQPISKIAPQYHTLDKMSNIIPEKKVRIFKIKIPGDRGEMKAGRRCHCV